MEARGFVDSFDELIYHCIRCSRLWINLFEIALFPQNSENSTGKRRANFSLLHLPNGQATLGELTIDSFYLVDNILYRFLQNSFFLVLTEKEHENASKLLFIRLYSSSRTIGKLFELGNNASFSKNRLWSWIFHWIYQENYLNNTLIVIYL